MRERPTPEELAVSGHASNNAIRQAFLAWIHEYGYRIVHPDDVPRMIGSDIRQRQDGWNACRAHIFGGDDE